MITAVGASLVYEDHGKQVVACRSIDLRVGENEFLGILGPSGSGKSSLLYLLSGLKNPTSGEVNFEGRTFAAISESERARIRLGTFGFVFQQPYLLGYLSALENVLLVNPKLQAAAGRAAELLAEVGLKERAHRMPSELSGGEKQRVCVARALFQQPSVVFADEPTASLDHASGEAVVRLLRDRRKGALIVVTHDPSILDGADRILTMEDGSLVGR